MICALDLCFESYKTLTLCTFGATVAGYLVWRVANKARELFYNFQHNAILLRTNFSQEISTLQFSSYKTRPLPLHKKHLKHSPPLRKRVRVVQFKTDG